MSLENYQRFLYKELPEQNLAFVEGGILVYPSMVGLSLPLKMTDNDMYQYLNRFILILTFLEKAKDIEDGKNRTKILAEALEIPHDKFLQDNQYLYMVESLMRNKMLPTDFDSIQSVYSEQARRARVMYFDISEDADPNIKEQVKRGNKFLLDLQTNPKTVKEDEVVVEDTSSADTLPPSEDYVESPSIETSLVPHTPISSSPTPTGGLVDKAKSLLTKPPFLIGLVAITGVVLTRALSPEDEEEPRRLPNKKRKQKNKKLAKQGYRK